MENNLGYYFLTSRCPKCADRLIALQEVVVKKGQSPLCYWHITCDACEFDLPEHFSRIEQLPPPYRLENKK